MESVASYLDKTLTASHWKRIGVRPHHGICLPLASLRTHNSCGIGDFGDLLPLIDWCQSVGFDCIQLLPLNDSGDDPSPYNALSSCALDPIYLNLRDLPNGSDDLSIFAPIKDLPRLPHFEIKHRKIEWLHRYFENSFHELKTSPDYQAFCQQNPWLSSYALFKACKDEYGGKHWEEWPIEKRSPTTCTANQIAIDFHCFLQYWAFRQMEKAKRYADAKGIFLKGDIPILLSPDSADVWANRSLFNMRYSAGAPPDYYARLGQKWGFPLFEWDEHRRTGFAWWKQRLAVASRFFHLYRIDHVVGFFRIWAIRPSEKPAQGRYLPEDPHLWGQQGQEILEMMIHASSMLPMAEDLGASMPPIVFQTLRNLGICGTKVMRWVGRDDGGWLSISEYEPISLTTISTPDSETLQLWWKTRPHEAARLAEYKHWTYQPDLTIWQRQEILRDAHHTTSLFHINLLQEYLALAPSLVAANPEDERINIPGTQLPTNWTYRFKPTLEEIAGHRALAEEIRHILH
ncbi:MAG: malQ [Parachlamydiales bacterium]|nr:malQ [Parachlamydiales bacterium]